MRLVKIALLIIFFVSSIIFFVQNMNTLSKPLALRFDPLPTFTKVEAPVAPTLQTEALGMEETAAADPGIPVASFLSWKSDGVPLYIVVLATFMTGVIFTSLFFIIDRIRQTYSIVSKKRKIRELEGIVKRLQSEKNKAAVKTKNETAHDETASPQNAGE